MLMSFFLAFFIRHHEHNSVIYGCAVMLDEHEATK